LRAYIRGYRKNKRPFSSKGTVLIDLGIVNYAKPTSDHTVAYDISSDEERTRVDRLLLGYAFRQIRCALDDPLGQHETGQLMCHKSSISLGKSLL